MEALLVAGKYCRQRNKNTEKTPKIMARKKAKAAIAPSALFSVEVTAWRLCVCVCVCVYVGR